MMMTDDHDNDDDDAHCIFDIASKQSKRSYDWLKCYRFNLEMNADTTGVGRRRL